MSNHAFHDDILHAYIDNDLDVTTRQQLLTAIHEDPELRQRVCDLQETKAWVSLAFANAEPPERDTPPRLPQRHAWYGRAAAVMLAVLLGFLAGWVSHFPANNGMSSVLISNIEASNHRVLLHISDADGGKFQQVMNETEYLLKHYQSKGIQVEVLANAGGLNLLRVDMSPYAQRIAQLINKYDNVRFIACANSIQRAQERGEKVILLDKINTQPTAIDHAIQRLKDGWTYIQV